MKDSIYTVAFATIMGIVCAVLLTGAKEVLGPLQKANMKAEKDRNILGVLGIDYEADASNETLAGLSEKYVTPPQDTDVVKYYKYIKNGEVQTVAINFEGPGLWEPIKGFLALNPDMTEIAGVTFYEQKETPGLGGEIVKDWFREPFVGKKIRDAAGNPGIEIVAPGTKLKDNQVHGISGATITSDKVEIMINAAIIKVTSKQ